MGEEIIGTFVGRWYVTLFGLTFLWFASRHIGWRRTGIYALLATVVGTLAENGSVHLGFPYTSYSFNDALRGHELFIVDAPLMVTMSYMFMAYFAFAAGRLIVAGPYRTRGRMPVLEYVVATTLGVWAAWVLDPASRLGDHFFLGELFRYDGPGFWFGLPLGSQLGFTLTIGILVGILTWLARDEQAVDVDRLLAHPRLPALGAFFGQVLFMTGTCFVVARTTADPAVAQVADAIAGSTFIITIPAALITAVHWRSITLARRDEPAGVEAPDDRSVEAPDDQGVGAGRR